MSFYYILFIILAVIGAVKVSHTDDGRYVLSTEGNVFLPCMLMCLISGFRSLSVGNDNLRYARRFLDVGKNDISFERIGDQWMYRLLNLLIKTVWENTTFFNTCCAIIIFGCLAFFLYKYSSSRWLSCELYLTLGLFFACMNQTRQNMATAFALIGFYYAMEKQCIRAIAFGIMAMLIHAVLIFMIPILIVIVYMNITKKTVVWATIVSGGVVIASDFFFQLFVRIFPRYETIVKSVLFAQREASIWRYGDFAITVIIQIALIYGIMTRELDEGNQRMAYILACMNALTIAISYMVIRMQGIERVKQVLMYWMLLSIPFVIKFYFDDLKQLYFLVAIASLLYMWHLGIRDGHGVIPYSSVFH